MDILELRDKRETEQYILTRRNTLYESHSSWKKRISDFDMLYRGDWNIRFPDETSVTEQPWVSNFAKDAIHDVARLTTEVRPAIKSIPLGDSASSARKAQIRETIADTYWDMNHAEKLVKRWTMDLTGTGTAFAVVWSDHRSPYPQVTRLDPRNCYPDVKNGSLYDLVHTERMTVRMAARLFPDLGLENIDPAKADEAEIIDYYDDTFVYKCVILTYQNEARDAYLHSMWEHKLECPPIGFIQMDSSDGAFRGMFDQVHGGLLARNKMVKHLLDYTESAVHAPIVAKGVINPDDPPGPTTIYQLDPNSPDSQMGRLQPAVSSPDVFGTLQLLENEIRESLFYPASRTGNVKQSIASASFVASTQGQLTSVVREAQDQLGDLRRQLNELMFKVDEKHLNKEKPLIRSVGAKDTYKPKVDIGGWHYTQVIYGAAAGLDRLNADVRVLQHKGAGLISEETAREQIDYLTDATSEREKIEREAVANAILQKFAGDPAVPVGILIEIHAIQAKGKSFTEALAAVQAKLEAQAAAQQQAAAPAQAAPVAEPTTPEDTATQQLALQRGQVPQGAGEVEFAPPPLEQIFVR